MLKERLAAVKAVLAKGIPTRKLLASTLCIGCATALMFGGKASAAADNAPAAPDSAPVWTVTMIQSYNKAVTAYNRQDWATAKNEFRDVISRQDNIVDFYLGLLNTCMHSGEWDQVVFAAEKLGTLDPVLKNQVAFDYGMALYKLNRYAEAVPVLKRALTVADQPIPPPYHPTIKDEQLVAISNPGANTPVPYVPPVAVDKPPPVIPRVKLDPEQYLTFEQAIKSESIVLATYEGYEKGDIHFNNPPISQWHITKILKGPPLNARFPLRYEFHDLVNKAMPAGWKFDEAKMMPKKGSDWIIFIEFASAKNGAFETYQGSYGRQPATEDNLNDLYARMDAHNMREQLNE